MTAPLTTARLRLRQWRDEDYPAFAALNADPRVMEHFPKALDREESDAMAGRIRQRIEKDGYGLWAVEVVGQHPFIGYVGLTVPRFEAHFTPCIELGWRLAQAHWGHGFATEAAHAACAFAFERLSLAEIVAFTVPANSRSRGVMARLGMTRDPADDFAHPRVAESHPLRLHVLYRLTARDWMAGQRRASKL
jgi:RimJ/RimL family protein N-acetyltransferase